MDMAHNGSEEVSTVFIAGFPPDAFPRELDNLCRFFPGFVTSNVSTTKGVTVFALFDSGTSARQAIEVLNGQPFDRSQESEPMRATLARQNMRATRSSGGRSYGGAPRGQIWGPSNQYQPPPPTTPHPMHGHDGGSKRPRIPEDPNQIDTVASVGAAERGFDETRLRTFYQSLPGFVGFKGNPRMGGGFAKFESPIHALEAVEMAKLEGIPAEMARSSMSLPGEKPSFGGGGHGPVPAPATIFPSKGKGGGGKGSWGGRDGGSSGPPSKRPRMYEDPAQIDTVACVGAKEAGFDEMSLRSFFEGIPGFLVFKANPRMGGGFVKFDSPETANSAIQAAQEAGIPAAMAKSSMSA